MQFDKKENYTYVSSDENSFQEFYNTFIKQEKEFKKEHVIVHISNEISVSTEDFLLFLKVAEQKNENGTSFVIINTVVNVDDFPENLNIVPTLQEAEDILEMENIERELGF
ncbi:hypothetical protein FDT66_00615 [Polaribacter aestuariivivens]|uniref:Uncharacterized protein n=1 Tax=Polaribacter aestuariivivens TaxID=2304626 RepID=A0A5S3N9P6_9FLAO|nr:hypothetical protein [Polaribacter aestuariivivens]TMM32001.1 hypothetical protein FDT66_00615 [Polaribacter aestuariivivens]